MKINRLFGMIALLLCFALVLTGCGDSRESSRREYTYDEDEESELQETEPETEPEPVYEKQTVYLCVRTTMEQWDGSGVSVSEYEYDQYGNQTISRNVTHGGYTEYTYNEEGMKTASVSYQTDGTVSGRYAYIYDDKGNLVIQSYYNGEGEIKSETFFNYDDEGWLVNESRHSYYSKESTVEYKMEYNADHTQATIYTYSDGEMVNYTVESYDAAGNILESNTYSTANVWQGRITYEYDDQGRIAVEWHYSSRETQADYDVIYTYDENGLLVFKDVSYYYGYGMTYEYEPFEILVLVED